MSRAKLMLSAHVRSHQITFSKKVLIILSPVPVCSVVGLRFVTRKTHVVGSCPVTPNNFFGVLAKTRGIFLGFLDIRGRRQIFLAAFSFSFGVDSA